MIAFKRLFMEGVRNPSGFLYTVRHLPNFLRLYARLLRDQRVPTHLKAMLLFAVGYVISPLDFFPDFIVPIFGYLDDLFILLATARYFLRRCPPQVVAEHVKQIQNEINK